jgi:LacI family transcriptional regulator
MNEAVRPPATLQNVADAAGVHRSTASRALNPDTAHLVADEVVERIRAHARRLGYRRDAMAAGLRTKRSRLVGVVVPDIANPVFGPILSAIEIALRANGFSALVVNAGADPQEQIGIVESLVGRRVEGLVLATARQDDPVVTYCLAAGVPTVLVNRAEADRRASAVVSDDVLGLRLAVQHLIGLGHRRIGHLAGPPHLSTGALRRRGYEEAMRIAGLEREILVEAAAAYTRPAGRAAAESLLDRGGVTAIAAANDLLALGAYEALAARGLACPQDVSIVGHNDMPLVDMVAPPLTTIRIGLKQMGDETARLLLEQMRGRPETVTRIVEPQLVVRGSTAPPRRG